MDVDNLNNLLLEDEQETNTWEAVSERAHDVHACAEAYVTIGFMMWV